MKELGDREAQNIFELEVDKLVAGPFPLGPVSEVSLSFSQAFQGFPHRTPASPFRSG